MIYSVDYEPTKCALIPIPIKSLGAFGNGQHATTLASLKILEEIKAQKSLLDVGTGTGILAIAAQKLGYQDIVATDIDPNALESAKYNFQMNQVSIPLVDGSFPENHPPFDIVISNILVPEVLRLIPQLLSNLSDHEDARLILSGFHSANRDLVIEACTKEGLLLDDERKEREWLALAFVRRRKK
jgi:ribosomal protein L11 methyltransferase